jgi:hypothetical protein
MRPTGHHPYHPHPILNPILIAMGYRNSPLLLRWFYLFMFVCVCVCITCFLNEKKKEKKHEDETMASQ